MTPAPAFNERAALGLAARVLLAFIDGDSAQVGRLVNADPDAAMNAMILLGAILAREVHGEQVRVALGSLATAADLDAIGREVAG